MGDEIRLPQTVNPFDYCSDTFRPIVKRLNPEVIRPAIVSKPSSSADGIEFHLASNIFQLLRYHEINQEVFDEAGHSWFNPNIAIERMKIIIALKMLNIDYEHCKI